MKKFFLGGVLFAGMVCHALAASLTGIYVLPASTGCSQTEIDDSSGAAYIAHCFSGDAYNDALGRLDLVQNGDKLCGTYSSCGGLNCSKVYFGEVVGQVKKGRVVLYYADGHREEGLAPTMTYDVLPQGLGNMVNGQVRKQWVRRKARLRNPAAVAQCRPKLDGKGMRLKNYALVVAGVSRGQDKMALVDPPRQVYAQAPAAHYMAIKPGMTSIAWQDPDQGRNQILRQVHIHNRTGQMWELAVEHPQACKQYIRDKHIQKRTPPSEADDSTVRLPAHARRTVVSCRGSSFSLQPQSSGTDPA